MILKNLVLPTLRLIFLPLAFVALVSSCDRNSQPIKIGMSINLSGRGGVTGEHIRDGAMLAVDEVNKNGGINGRPLYLLVRDDENSDEGIRKADESLVKEGVVAIIGHSYSSNTIKAYPYITSSGTLMLTAYTATTSLSGKDDLFLRSSIDCNLYGIKTAALLAEKNVMAVSFLMDMNNADFVNDYVEQVQKNYQGGVTTVQVKSKEKVNWDKVANDLMANNAQAIVMLTESTMTAMAAQELKSRNYNGAIIATPWAQSPELIRIGGPATEGISIITFIDPDNRRPEYLKFSENLQRYFGKPATARSARAYEMINMLAQALGTCKNITANELKAELLKGQYNSILGPVSFDRFGDVQRPVYEIVLKNGRFTNAGEIY